MYLLSFRFKLLLIFFPLSLLFQHVVGIRSSVTLTASPNETTTGATISFAWNGANGRPVTLDLKVPSNAGTGYVRIVNVFKDLSPNTTTYEWKSPEFIGEPYYVFEIYPEEDTSLGDQRAVFFDDAPSIPSSATLDSTASESSVLKTSSQTTLLTSAPQPTTFLLVLRELGTSTVIVTETPALSQSTSTPPSSLTETTPSSPTMSSVQTTVLSTNIKAGIGVGVGFGALLMISLLLFAFVWGKKYAARKSSYNETSVKAEREKGFVFEKPELEARARVSPQKGHGTAAGEGNKKGTVVELDGTNLRPVEIG